MEEMASWKDDLASRLWRAESVLRVTGQFLYDIKEIEREVELYREIMEQIKRMRSGERVEGNK